MVVNTPLGFFQYQRIPYAIASAAAIFQSYLEQLLIGIEECVNYQFVGLSHIYSDGNEHPITFLKNYTNTYIGESFC